METFLTLFHNPCAAFLEDYINPLITRSPTSCQMQYFFLQCYVYVPHPVVLCSIIVSEYCKIIDVESTKYISFTQPTTESKI